MAHNVDITHNVDRTHNVDISHNGDMAHSVDMRPAAGVPGSTDLQLEIEHLRRALASRDEIGQAKGILMERYKVTADEAFALLVQASQHTNVRVAELSTMLAETGEWAGPTPQ